MKCKNYVVEIEFDNWFLKSIHALVAKFTNLVAAGYMGTAPGYS